MRFDEEAKPGISNLLTIYSALTGEHRGPREAYAGRGYGDFKGDLADVVVEFVTPFRDRTLELLDDRAELDASCATAPARPRGRRAHPGRRLRARRLRAADGWAHLGCRRVTTIGVAIAVPEPWGSELQDYRVGARRRVAPRIPTHITLLPPIDVDDAELPRHRASTWPRRRRRSRRSGSTCAAPAPSGRSRRWSSSTWSRASPTASSSPPACAAARSPSTRSSPTTRTSPSPTTSPEA